MTKLEDNGHCCCFWVDRGPQACRPPGVGSGFRMCPLLALAGRKSRQQLFGYCQIAWKMHVFINV